MVFQRCWTQGSRLLGLRVALLALLLVPAGAWACAYNVRDVGFVDLDRQPYRLYAFIDGTTPEPVAAAFGQAAYSLFLESNVHVELVHLGETPLHAAKPLLEQAGVTTLPAAIVTTPAGDARNVPLPADPEAIRPALEQLLVSPKRNELMNLALAHYAVVLLVEGTDAAANARAESAITEANRQMGTRMAMLPKKVERPPVLTTLTRAEIAQEAWTLWALGMDPESAVPQAVVLYGKVRRLGPNLTGDAITAEQVGMYLNVIGADCECGLDRSWMQGTMLPVAWDEARRAEAAKALQFDPEDPMVKMEISMALSKSAHSDPSAPAPSLSSITYGYQETTVGDPSPAPEAAEAAPETPPMPAPAATPIETTSPPPASIPRTVYAIAAIAGVVILGAAGLLLARCLDA
jgi:hypothetical protein